MKNDNVISLNEALKIFSLKDGKGMYKPFSMSYRTFNETSKKGGKLINYDNVRYLPSANSEVVVNEDKTVRPPNHFLNRTRNIELQSGEIKSIKIDFIISINNKKVIY